MRDPHQLAPPVAFFHLTVDQPSCHLPPAHVPPSLAHLEPLSKMSRKGIEVHIEAITGEQRQTIMGQKPSQGVDEHMRRMLCAGTQMQYGQNLGEGVDSQPQPKHLGGAAQPCSQFIQLHVWEMQVAEGVLMEEPNVHEQPE